MHFSTVFSALAVVVVSGAMATVSYTPDSISSASGLTAQNCYGTPIPPWKSGHYPGWHYGQGTPPAGDPHVFERWYLLHLGFFYPKAPPPVPPHSPPPSPEYTQVFYDLSCAVQDYSYETYGLVDTVQDCQAMCDSVAGCGFVNTYYDNNSAAKNSDQLTCGLLTRCLAASAEDNSSIVLFTGSYVDLNGSSLYNFRRWTESVLS
ncbi:hypothetical protein DFH09DRAFT_1081550 [Mycena vulgaris]|nr:hypothetical protein DFH09DRAFT_1081550 [Mycena vulgaris]